MLHAVLLYVHISTATVGISSGFLAMLVRKGSSLHRLAGNIFFGAMLAMSGSAAYMAMFMKSVHVNVIAGLLTFYLVATAWWAAKRRDGGTGAFDVAALFFALAVGAAAITFGLHPTTNSPAGSCFVFASMTLLFAAGDVRMLVRGGIAGARRIRRHLWRMCLALLIAVVSFFPGQAQLFPAEVRKMGVLYAPHILLVLSMIFWMVRTSNRKRIVKEAV